MSTGKIVNETRLSRAISDFVRKMNALGITPMIHITQQDVTIAFSVPEMLASLKKSLIQAGVPEAHLTIEVVPFKGEDYIKIYIRK